MTPVRIQRRRTKGWRMPPNTVSVTRPGRWGNPFYWKEGLDAGDPEWAKGTAAMLYGEWVLHPHRFPERGKPPAVSEIKRELRGKNLACFCKESEPCHAEFLLGVANS